MKTLPFSKNRFICYIASL